jgi:hypothetical protein
MTLSRYRSAFYLTFSALAGLTTPWTLTWLLGHLGSIEVSLVERLVAHFPGTRSGVHCCYTSVASCVDAIVCAVLFGVPLSFLAGGQFLRCWLVFMVAAVTAHIGVSLLAPVAPIGRFATAILIISLPFWWLFALALLGFLALAARVRTRLRLRPNNRWRGP